MKTTIATLAYLAAIVPLSTQQPVADPVVEVSQADFASGSFLITEPGTYQLVEDIIFSPNDPGDLSAKVLSKPELIGFPTEEQRAPGTGEYSLTSFSLGFFAAVIIAANDVVFDLNGHSIEQSELHLTMQRFFAVIEITNSPFPNKAGPADFISAEDFVTGSDVTIQNGVIGKSAHHGIHCNNCRDITLKDLIIKDFEVAGISLNAADDVTIEDVVIQESKRDVALSGRFSQAIFALQALSVRLGSCLNDDLISTFPAEFNQLFEAQKKLRKEVAETIKIVINEGAAGTSKLPQIFGTVTNGLPDGSLLAGILLHSSVNVGNFKGKILEAAESSTDVTMRNVLVEKLSLQPTERTVLETEDGKTVTDMIGAVFDFESVRDTSSKDFDFVSNTLADFQIAMAKFKLAVEDVQDELSASCNGLLNRNGINQEVIDWSEGKLTWFDLIVDSNFKVISGHDFMKHFNKGIVGIKLDQVHSVSFDNVTVRDLENHATDGDRATFFRNLDLVEKADFDISRISLNTDAYQGFSVKGVSFAGNVRVDGSVNVSGLSSNNADDVNAVDYINENLDVQVNVETGKVPDTAEQSLIGKLESVEALFPYFIRNEFKEGNPLNLSEDLLFNLFIAQSAVIGLLILLLCCKLFLSKVKPIKRKRNSSGKPFIQETGAVAAVTGASM